MRSLVSSGNLAAGVAIVAVVMVRWLFEVRRWVWRTLIEGRWAPEM